MLRDFEHQAVALILRFQRVEDRFLEGAERAVGFGFGTGVGVLYSVTTISGPPLAVMLSNQGLTKRDFRAALGFIRLAESSFTAVAYACTIGRMRRGRGTGIARPNQRAPRS